MRKPYLKPECFSRAADGRVGEVARLWLHWRDQGLHPAGEPRIPATPWPENWVRHAGVPCGIMPGEDGPKQPRGYREKGLALHGLDDRDVWAAIHWLNEDFVEDVLRARRLWFAEWPGERFGGPIWPLEPKVQAWLEHRWPFIDRYFWNDPWRLTGELVKLPPWQLPRGQDVGRLLLATWRASVYRALGYKDPIARTCERLAEPTPESGLARWPGGAPRAEYCRGVGEDSEHHAGGRFHTQRLRIDALLKLSLRLGPCK